MRTLTHVSSASAGTRIRSARRTVGNLWEIDRHCHARACQLTPAHHPIVPIRQTVDHALGQTLHRRGFDPGPVAERVDLAKSNVLTNKQDIAHVILEDDTDFAAQILHVALAQVDSVQQNLPFGVVVEPCQKLDQGRFSGSVLTN